MGLLSDNYGNIWGSTNKGLFRMNVKNGAVKNFDVTDGLQGNEFNRFAYLKLDNGVMIFGGLNGINYFKPDKIQAIMQPDVSILNSFIGANIISADSAGHHRLFYQR